MAVLSISGSYLVPSGAQPRLPEASGISEADDISLDSAYVGANHSTVKALGWTYSPVCPRTDQGQAAGLRKQQS